MVFPILGGNSAVAGGYSIDNSVMFNDGDSPYLARTPSSSSNRKTWTYSFWTKLSGLTNNRGAFLDVFTDANNWFAFFLDTTSGYNGKIRLYQVASGTDYGYTTDALFRDVSAWYHIVVAVDTTQATASNRVKLYINGNQITFNQQFGDYPQNYDTWVNSTVSHKIGRYTDGTKYVDGYMAEAHFIDGTAKSPTDFGEFDSDSGIWKPKQFSGSYGTNGFYLNFSNTTTIGEDSSGNGNDFSATNIDTVCRGVTDTPTNNFCTINPLTNFGGGSINVGNLKISSGNDMIATMGVTSGRWYWEAKKTDATTTGHWGISCANFHRSSSQNVDSSTGVGTILLRDESSNNYFYQNSNGITITSVVTDNNLGVSQNQIVGVYLDLDSATKSISFYVNGSLDVKINFTYNDTSIPIYPLVRMNSGCVTQINFGHPIFSISSGNTDANGYGNFEYSPTLGGTDYLALCTQNLATALSPTIDDGSAYFSATKYQGGGFSAQSITGVGFQPDWVWVKNRTVSASHVLYDSNRGVQKALFSESTSAETTRSGLTSFDSDGFSLGSAGTENGSSSNEYISWNWKANGGTTSSNTDGSITSTVQANTTAGFSIVTYTGTGSNATVGHGLGVAPKMIICKQRNNTVAHDWMVYHEGIGNTKYLNLNQTNASGTASTVWQNTTPTSSVFSVGTSGSVNESGKNQLAYCFAEIEGYSKFGSYTGNGSSDGTFVYTGFRPAWVMTKGASTAQAWSMRDNKRDSYNSAQKAIYANASDAESDNANNSIDLLSNGFKIRNLFGTENSSGQTYIYMAFAENPFVTSSGVPVVAR